MDPKVWKDPDVFRPERFLDKAGKVIARESVIAFSLEMVPFTDFIWVSMTFIAVLILTKVLKKKSVSRRYPPSLPSLPLVGSLPFIRNFNNLHEFFMSKTGQLGPIFSFRVGRSSILTLNSTEVIEEALVTNSTCFAGREQFYLGKITNKNGKGIAAMNFSTDFKRYHRISLSVLREFGFGVDRLMETRIHQEFEAMDAFIRTKQGKGFNPCDMARIGMYNVIKNIVFGKREDYENVLDEIPTLFMLFVENVTPTMEVAPALLSLLPYFSRKVKICIKCASRIKSILEEDIASVTESKVECFVSRYLAQIGPDYDHEQLVYTVRDLIAAGFETTSTALLWLLMFIANNSAVQKRLQKEVDDVVSRNRLPSLDDQHRLPFVEATVLEIMRIRTIAPLTFPHITLSDSEVGGYFIPTGTKVLVNLHAAHMDVKRWKDPNVFRPERFLDEDNNIIGRDGVIPFSLGRRSCTGEILARQELFLFLACCIQKFHIQPGEDGQKIDETPVAAATMRPLPFKIRMIPREIGY